MQTWKEDEFLPGVKFSRPNIKKIYRESASGQVQLFSFVNFRATSQFHVLYFSTYCDINTLSSLS